MEERRFLRIFLILPSLLVLYFIFRIFQPFLMPIFMAIILVCLCFPAFQWINLKARGYASLASLITCLAITALILIPFAGLALMLAAQAREAYQQLQQVVGQGHIQEMMSRGRQPYLGGLLEALDAYIDLDKLDLFGSMAALLKRLSLEALRHSSSIFSGIANLLTNFLIMIVTMFFLFRDGPTLVDKIRRWIPLSLRYQEQIVRKFQEVSNATVIGSLTTAIAQGIAGGITFFLVGIPNIIFWGTLIALFSLVPLFGTAIVWLPWTLYLLAIGKNLHAFILVVLSIVFVGGIDNILRPILIEGKTKMHTLLIFFSIMGGISYFGIVGLLVGPIIMALGLTFLDLYRIEFKRELVQSNQK